MALVLPVNLANIEAWINWPNVPGVLQPDILAAANFLQTTVFPVADHAQLQRISRQIMDQIEFAGIPGIVGYFALLNALLFLNPSTAPHVYQQFCNRAVQIDSFEIILYLQNLPPPPPPIVAQRDLIIQELIVEAIQQHAPATDKRPFLIRILEQCRVGVGGGFGLPQWIQFAMTEAVNRANDEIIDELIMQYRNDVPLVQFLTNGILESVVPGRFAELQFCLDAIGMPLPPPRQQAGGGPLIAATDPPILLRAAAYSLTGANLRAVLIPANLALVPRIIPFIVAIRNEIVNVTAASAWPAAALAGIPGQYFDEVIDPVSNMTLPEKAADMGNLAVIQAIIAINPPLNAITYTRVSPTTGFTLMQTAMQNHNYDIAQAIWVANGNLYPAAWFTPGHVINTGRRNTQITNAAFRTAFDNAYRIFNPGTAAPRGVIGMALGVRPAYGPLTPAQQLVAADGVLRLLNAMPDFIPNVGKNAPLGSAVLKQMTTIRDELERITDPTVWDARRLIPLIARKGAIADGTVLPRANLLEIGIRLGANPNIADVTGTTALHYVASYPVLRNSPRLTTPRSIIMLKTLLAAPLIDVNIAGPAPGGDTALHRIVGVPDPSIEHLKLLAMDSKLDYDLTNAAGDTPLIHFIKQHGPVPPAIPYHTLAPIMKILIAKSDMTIIDTARNTALWNAINLVADDAYLASIVPDLAKGLTGVPPAGPVATELALAVARPPPPPIPLTIAALTAINAAPAALPLPAWLPDEYKAILNDTTVDASIRAEARQYITQIDAYMTGGPPSDADNMQTNLNNNNIWWFLRNVRGVPIPVVGAVLPPFPIAATGNEPATFDVRFNDGTQYALATPYRSAYRAGTVYTGTAGGAPVTPVGTTAPNVALAQINNDVLQKLTGTTYITNDPTRQRILKRLLNEMYYAQYNPALGNDLLTLLLHLRAKLDHLITYQGVQTAKTAAASLLRLGTWMLAFVNSIIVPAGAPPALGFGFRFPSSVPMAIAFPPIIFPGISPVGAMFAAAGAAAAGILPVIPGLAAPLFIPPVGAGLAAMVAGGGAAAPVPVLINIFTGAPIDNAIVTSNYPVSLTLGPNDAFSHLPAPAGPIINVNGHQVNRSDSFYNFLQQFGLTTIKGGLAYILRPAEIFIALFHLTNPQLLAAMQNPAHPFKVLLRDYCIRALIEFALFKNQPAVAADLRVARGKL